MLMKEGLRRHSVAQQQRRQEKSSRINLGFPNSLNSLDRVSRCFQEGSITDGVCCVHYCACFLHVCEETAVLALPNDDVYLLHPLSAYSYDMEFFCRFFFLGASSQLIPPCEGILLCRRETARDTAASSVLVQDLCFVAHNYEYYYCCCCRVTSYIQQYYYTKETCL